VVTSFPSSFTILFCLNEIPLKKAAATSLRRKGVVSFLEFGLLVGEWQPTGEHLPREIYHSIVPPFELMLSKLGLLIRSKYLVASCLKYFLQIRRGLKTLHSSLAIYPNANTMSKAAINPSDFFIS
jgi:hypothetical protein